MKKNVLKGVALSLLLGAATAGCSDEWSIAGNGAGRIDLTVDLSTAPVTASTAKHAPSRAPIKTEVTADKLSLTLTALQRQFSQTWASVAEFANPEDGFITGRYTLEAYYGTDADEGYGKPYYYGSQELEVKNASTTEVSVTATLANSIVAVEYTDAFKNFMTSYGAKIHSEGGAYFDWNESASDDLYVRPGEVTLSVSFAKPGSSETVELEAARFTAKPRYRHTVTVDVNGGAVGKAESLVITFDDTVDQKEVVLDISDAYLSVSAPVLTPAGFTDGQTFDLLEHFTPDAPVKANVMARGRIASATLTTQSSYLLAKGWPAEVDLANPGAAKEVLTACGLKTLGIWTNPDMMGIIDFSGVFAALGYVDGASNENLFTLVVKDQRGQISQPLSFGVKLKKLDLAITGGSITADGSALLQVRYNGPAPATDLVFDCKNARGTLSRMAIANVSPAVDAGSYMIKVTSPEIHLDTDLQLRASMPAAQFVGPFVIVKAPVMIMDASRMNAFGTSAYVTIDYTNPEAAAQSDATEIYLNGSRVNTAPAAAAPRRSRAVSKTVTFRIPGLAPATTYNIYAKLGDDRTFTTSLTTEEAAQIPNGNLDADVTVDGSASNWENFVVPGWGTNNPMTTSQGSNYGYCRVSGTRQTTDAHSGKAISLQTFGWGSGNTAITGVNGNMKYADPGLLHLGSSRTVRPNGYGDRQGPLTTDDLDCGIPFTSRPSSVTFWYKYSPKNSADRGLAEVWVKDADGNILASGSTELGATDSYTQVSFPLTYTSASRKAAKLYVKFLSCNDRSLLEKNSSNFNGPGWGNLGRGTYNGSTLFIDDIVLNY